ncbi:hypothetical protein L345_14110, partial [Ophiophagus hannah]
MRDNDVPLWDGRVIAGTTRGSCQAVKLIPGVVVGEMLGFWPPPDGAAKVKGTFPSMLGPRRAENTPYQLRHPTGQAGGVPFRRGGGDWDTPKRKKKLDLDFRKEWSSQDSVSSESTDSGEFCSPQKENVNPESPIYLRRSSLTSFMNDEDDDGFLEVLDEEELK